MSQEREQLQFLGEPEIKGLIPETVSNLKDILYKWGRVTADDAMVRFRSGPLVRGVDLHLSTSADPEKQVLIVGKSSTMDKGLYIIKTGTGEIIWDKELKSYEAELAIALVDEKARKQRLIDENGNRKPLKPEEAFEMPGKYHVDEVFAERGAGFVVFPGEDPQKYLEKFDKPEELEVITLPGAEGATIIRKSDLGYVKRRENLVRQLLQERGLNVKEAVETLSFQEIMDIREEATKRLAEQQDS